MNHKKFVSIKSIFEYHTSQENVEDIDFAFDLVNFYRNKSRKNPVDLAELLSEIRENEQYNIFFREKLISLFFEKKKTILLTDAGLLNSTDFFRELFRRLSHKIIPDQPSQENIQYILNQIFHKPTDYEWLKQIPIQCWDELFSILSLKTFYDDNQKQLISKQILLAILILSQRMGGMALRTDVRRMVPEYTSLESPFIALDNELNAVFKPIQNGEVAYLDLQTHDIDLKQLNVLANQCEDFVRQATGNTSKYGISFQVNQTLLLIGQQISRIRMLYQYLFLEDENDKKSKTISFYLNMVQINSMKNNVKKLINDSIYNITYEITNYTGRSGEHYITSGVREFFKMFRTALGGGFIVGILCLIKLYLSTLQSSEFVHALGYSLNYGLGFVAIYLTGATLATKQPAMTASTIAKSLEKINLQDKKERTKQYYDFSVLFTRVFRSQFIAFAGNVLAAFPIALLLIFALTYFTDSNMAALKSTKLLAELDLRKTPVIFHSFIAGIFLFLSGIIAGNVASVNNYNNFYYRISEHPFLKGTLGKDRMLRVAAWLKKKWPGVVSNMWFGVFMGSTSVVGNFLGLNLDIRHITFASGNFALGLFGEQFQVSLNVVIWSLVGIFLIGFVNFIVSFSLSLLIALRSRKIPLSETRNMIQSVWNRFKEKPWSFFIPVGFKVK